MYTCRYRLLPACFLLILSGVLTCGLAQSRVDSNLLARADEEVSRLMHEGGIPGLSMIIVDSDRQYIRTYGLADVAARRPVTPATLFQLGSCSKAFTALAVQQLAASGRIRLDAPVTRYLPWLQLSYRDTPVDVTLLELLHHTSGIRWQTLSRIPPATDSGALERTVRAILPIPLRQRPGRRYEYATINYDILALVVQTVTGEPFERYLQQNVFEPLKLDHTAIGVFSDKALLATGYKIGYFTPRPYVAPVYRGNNAAGYVVSDSRDMARWLKFQLGLDSSRLYPTAEATHERDETVPLHGMASYAMGWEVALDGTGEIFHGGVNPNYTAYMALRPGRRLGLVLLANSNSTYTPVIGERILRLLARERREGMYDPGDGNDRAYSVGSLIVALYLLLLLAFLGVIITDIVRSRRSYAGGLGGALGKLGLLLIALAPFLTGIYFLPEALAGFSWPSMVVWSPVSFIGFVLLGLAAIALSCFVYVVTLLFPEHNRFKRMAPKMLLMSILSGGASMMVIILVTSALNSGIRLRYLVFYYLLIISVYLLGRRYVQLNLFRFSKDMIYDLRIKLFSKIFSTTYRQMETIDRGRIYAALSNDVETMGGSADQFILLVTNLFTTIVAFTYLSSIAPWATVLTILLIVLVSILYYVVNKSTYKYYDRAAQVRNFFLVLINGMIDGYKEISLHRRKKEEYSADLANTAAEYSEKIFFANARYVNAFLVGESMLIILLGVVAFAIPRMFPDIPSYTTISFIVVILYLIGPINGILNSVPSIMQVRMAWNRIRQFMHDIPANIDLLKPVPPLDPEVYSIRARGVCFRYRNPEGETSFEVGPIDLEVRSGEILFIIGGNGSGKTTLAKLLTGLYLPEEGEVLINGKALEEGQLGEYFSAVFNPLYLFEKLYNIDLPAKASELKKYLDLLDLSEKVMISGKKYSTIDLSGGQRKRLALLQCYLEDSPIYLFDEWAADQDPGYRNFFYRSLLPEMRKRGKIIIAITHDDHYFDVADKVLKMEQGRLTPYAGNYNASIKIKPLV